MWLFDYVIEFLLFILGFYDDDGILIGIRSEMNFWRFGYFVDECEFDC